MTFVGRLYAGTKRRYDISEILRDPTAHQAWQAFTDPLYDHRRTIRARTCPEHFQIDEGYIVTTDSSGNVLCEVHAH